MKKQSIVNQIVRQQPHNIVLDSYCAFYWAYKPWEATFEDWQHAARLYERYRNYKHYWNEVAPGWTTEETIYYADNSVAERQVCKCGEHRREVMTSPPSGDICF